MAEKNLKDCYTVPLMYFNPSFFPKSLQLAHERIDSITAPQTLQIVSVKYGVIERIFRTTVFQFAVYSAGWIEKLIFFIYRACVNRTFCPEPFSGKRMNGSLDILRALGAKDKYVIPEDGKAKIHMISMKSSDFENIIKSKGGQWIREGNEFIIIPPEQKNKS